MHNVTACLLPRGFAPEKNVQDGRNDWDRNDTSGVANLQPFSSAPYLSMRERMGMGSALDVGSSLRDASPARTGVAAHAYAGLLTYAAVMSRASTQAAFAGVFNLHITRAKLRRASLSR
jgi:hypothetical protein